LISGKNVFASIAARKMDVINLPRTLYEGRPSKDILELPNSNALLNLPPLALIDHIGSQHYTPYSFYRECVVHGPSRRIPHNIARAIAKHTPIPIVFTHSWLPVAHPAFVGDLLEWSGITPNHEGIAYIRPTWDNPDWGIRAKDIYHGDDHWIISVLRQMDKNSNGKEKPLTKIMPSILVENTLLAEQVYGISWINRVVYIASEEDTDEVLEDILSQGIEPVQIGQMQDIDEDDDNG
jgi:hypothetical protein